MRQLGVDRRDQALFPAVAASQEEKAGQAAGFFADAKGDVIELSFDVAGQIRHNPAPRLE